MKKLALLSFLLFGSISSNAQEISIEQIYANYVAAIGGQEALSSLSSKQTYTIQKGDLGTVENMEFVDFATIQRAAVLKNTDGTFTKQLAKDGVVHMDVNGTKMETGDVNPYKKGLFPETIVPKTARLLPIEQWKGEEVYVVQYDSEDEIPNVEKNEIHEYFSVSSGLRVATKQNIDIEVSIGNITSRSNTMNEFEYSDYKAVNGILIPHQIQMITATDLGDITTSTITLMTTLEVLFNTSIDDFRRDIFQNPKEAFDRYQAKYSH